MNALRAECAAFGAVLGVLSPDEWDLPTRCEPWTVRGLTGHVITVLSRVPDMIAAPAPEAPDTTAAGYYRDDERFSEATNLARVRAGQSRDVSATAFDTTVADVLTAVGSVAPDRLVRTRHGDAMRLGDFLTTRVVEVAVHGLDAADALGRPAWLTPSAAAEVLSLLFGIARPDLDWSPETIVRRATGRAPVTADETELMIKAGLRPLTLG